MSFKERPAPGTRVRVEFDGVVQPNDEYEHYWQVGVADGTVDPGDIGGRLHYVNWEADTVNEIKPPHPAVEEGQIWRADGQNFIAMQGHFESVENWEDYTSFFERHPDAELIAGVDGRVYITALSKLA